MEELVGEASGPAEQKKVMLIEAMQAALEKLPPPPPGTDVMSLRLIKVEMDHGGFTNMTRTRVTLEAQPGSLSDVH
ncbi:hypothetical protein [Aquisphaera giovannonii]|uniref:hypothetical protein n=1 Tax=Aquisphaera giovannonii TaxID=406548 RepID=UPI0011DFAC58|nr:hypothetical protein [Aquisphaera giovannonii]